MISRDFFEQQRYDEQMAEHNALVDRLQGDGIRVSELGRPVYTPPGYAYQEPWTAPAIETKPDTANRAGSSETEKDEGELMAMDAGVYAELAKDPLRFIKEMGPSISKGKLFGVDNPEAGELIALLMITDNFSFLDVKRRFHVVGKELTIRAEWMRSELRRLGGEYEWVNDGADSQEAIFRITFAGKTHDVSYTIGDAKREGLIKKGGNWELRPGDMLRARATSKAVRMYASEVLGGFCTDEEMAAMNGEVVHHDENGQAKITRDSRPATTTANVTTEGPRPTTETTTTTSPPAVGNGQPAPCTSKQAKRLNELFASLNLTDDQRQKALKKRNANAVRNLTEAAAAEFIALLEGKLAERSAAADAAAAEPSKADPEAQSTYNWAPCLATQIDKIKSLMIGSQDKDAIKGVVIAHLKANGKTKLNDLTVSDAELLTIALEKKELSMWADTALRPVKIDTPWEAPDGETHPDAEPAEAVAKN